jgi:serine phosphatase RsbU (regulator of sigma subunit)
VAREIGDSGPLVGVFDDAGWSVSDAPLEDGDSVVLYTDGVLDTVGEDGRFGAHRLFELLSWRTPDPQAIVRRVDGALGAFQSGPQRDDTAIVALTVVDSVALAHSARAQGHAGAPSAS